jgi:hypothetical protein
MPTGGVCLLGCHRNDRKRSKAVGNLAWPGFCLYCVHLSYPSGDWEVQGPRKAPSTKEQFVPQCEWSTSSILNNRIGSRIKISAQLHTKRIASSTNDRFPGVPTQSCPRAAGLFRWVSQADPSLSEELNMGESRALNDLWYRILHS